MTELGFMDRPWVAFDTETSGVDTDRDRIVSAAIVQRTTRSGPPVTSTWLIRPDGWTIPDEAIEIHHITNEHALEHGREARECLIEITDQLRRAWAAGWPVITCNGAFDCSILAAECRRHGLPAFEVTGCLIDVLAIDRAIDKWRAGSRKLDALAAHYRVKQTDAHASDGDALTAARVAHMMCQQHPALAVLPLDLLHEAQRRWYASWAESFEEYLRTKKGERDASIDRAWPMREPIDTPAVLA